MNHDQVVDLLTAISAYDNRRPNPASVLAWGKAAELGRWTLPEALDAVHWHFASSTDYLMPGHITAIVKAARQDRAMRDETLALTAAPADPVAAKRVEAIVDELAKSMGWSDRAATRASFAVKVRCPHCRAAVGNRCVNPQTGKPLEQSACHQSRADALAEMMRGQAS